MKALLFTALATVAMTTTAHAASVVEKSNNFVVREITLGPNDFKCEPKIFVYPGNTSISAECSADLQFKLNDETILVQKLVTQNDKSHYPFRVVSEDGTTKLKFPTNDVNDGKNSEQAVYSARAVSEGLKAARAQFVGKIIIMTVR